MRLSYISFSNKGDNKYLLPSSLARYTSIFLSNMVIFPSTTTNTDFLSSLHKIPCTVSYRVPDKPSVLRNTY